MTSPAVSLLRGAAIPPKKILREIVWVSLLKDDEFCVRVSLIKSNKTLPCEGRKQGTFLASDLPRRAGEAQDARAGLRITANARLITEA